MPLGVNLENSIALEDVNGLENDITPLVDIWNKIIIMILLLHLKDVW